MAQSQLQYKVLITPLESRNVYGAEIDVTADLDVSEFVTEKGIGKIKNQIDNGDYDSGLGVASNKFAGTIHCTIEFTFLDNF